MAILTSWNEDINIDVFYGNINIVDCGYKYTFIVDLTVSVYISLSDHLLHLLIRQLLSQVRHHMSEFCCTDETITILQGKILWLEGFVCVLLCRDWDRGDWDKIDMM